VDDAKGEGGKGAALAYGAMQTRVREHIWAMSRRELQTRLVEGVCRTLEAPQGVPGQYYIARLVKRCYDLGVIGPLCEPWIVAVTMPDGAPVFVTSAMFD